MQRRKMGGRKNNSLKSKTLSEAMEICDNMSLLRDRRPVLADAAADPGTYVCADRDLRPNL